MKGTQSVGERIRASLEEVINPSSIKAERPMVFLGGTCGDSKWRDTVIPNLVCDCYNPLDSNYTAESMQLEAEAKRQAALSLFVITPKQRGFQSFAELTAAAIRDPNRTTVAFLDKDGDEEFPPEIQKSLEETRVFLETNTGIVVKTTLDEATAEINERALAAEVVPQSGV